jgi:hypothetical protein
LPTGFLEPGIFHILHKKWAPIYDKCLIILCIK